MRFLSPFDGLGDMVANPISRNMMTNDHRTPQLTLIIEPDKKSMHLRINSEGKLHAGIVLSAEQLDATIAGLAQIRSQMLPEVPTKHSEAGPHREVKGTHFDFGVDETSKELIFSLRDAGLGWLSLRFSAKLLERMVGIAQSIGQHSPGAA